MKFLSLTSFALLSVNALKIAQEAKGEGNQDGARLPDLFSAHENGVANFKGTETTEMMKSSKTMAGLVFYYMPGQAESEKVVPEWVKVAKEMNVAGTGIRIEAVNGSWTADRASLGVTEYPAFKLFHFGDDQKGEDVPKDVAQDGTKKAFVKYLEGKGFSQGAESKDKKKPSAPPTENNKIDDEE